MDATAVLGALVVVAGLPPVDTVESVAGFGMDNQLLKAVLVDGRAVLLRRNKDKARPPGPRAAFLALHQVGAPRLHAATEDGDVLVDFVDGTLLPDLVCTGTVGDRAWRLVGAAFARVHAVAFPAPLQGALGPETVTLAPLDPVTQLLTKLDRAAGCSLTIERPSLLPVLDRCAVSSKIAPAGFGGRPLVWCTATQTYSTLWSVRTKPR